MSNSDAMKAKREARILAFLETNQEQFVEDFPKYGLAEMCKRYNIGESFFCAVRDYLGLKRTRQDAANKGGQVTREAKEAKILDFLANVPSDFKENYLKMSQRELCRMYGISVEILRTVAENLGLSRDQAVEARERAYQQRSISMHTVGNEKMRQTNMERYGTYRFPFSEQTKQKMRDGWTEEVKRAREQTTLERYGATTVLVLPQVRDKAIAASSSEESQKKRIATLIANKGTANNWNHEKAKATLVEKYGASNAYQLAKNPNSISKENRRIGNIFSNLGCFVVYEKLIGENLFDICVDDFILIEVNDSIAHSYVASFGQLTKKNPDLKPIDKDYHRRRFQIAAQNGYILLSLFDWMAEKEILDRAVSYLTKTDDVSKQNFVVDTTVLDNKLYIESISGTGDIFSYMKNYLAGANVSEIMAIANDNLGEAVLYNNLGFELVEEREPQVRYCKVQSRVMPEVPVADCGTTVWKLLLK